jgi:hypothetical protein
MRFRWKVTEVRTKPDTRNYTDAGKLIAEKKILQFNEDKWFSEWEDVYDYHDVIYVDKKGIIK